MTPMEMPLKKYGVLKKHSFGDIYPVINTHIDNDTDSNSEDIFFDAFEELDGMNSSLSKRKRDRENDTANPGPTKRIKMVRESSSCECCINELERETSMTTNFPSLLTKS